METLSDDANLSPVMSDLSTPFLGSAKDASKRSFACAASLLVAYIALFTLAASTVLILMPSLAVLGLLAYSFGCRHGIDADHIAAIDNVTRRMVAAGRRPMTIGIFFSLGHCTVCRTGARRL